MRTEIMIAKLYKYSPNFLKKIIKKVVLKLEKGEMNSKTIRQIYKECYGINIGIGSYGCFDIERLASNITIGKYCSFAQGVVIVPRREHPLEYISTHPFFFNDSCGWIKESPIKFNDFEIGNDVWIGQGAIICSKCTKIGNGAVIGAGSVVTRDIPPYAIVAGVPAKILRYRFEQDIICQLEASRWYELPIDELKKLAIYANSPALFIYNVNLYRSGNI